MSHSDFTPDKTAETSSIKPEEAKNKTKDFGAYLRAVEPNRMHPPANNPERPFMVNRQAQYDARDRLINTRLLQATGIIVSAMWLIGASVYVQRSVGWSNVSSLMPHEMGGFLAGILTPIALFWMIAAFILRSNDVKMYAEALRGEIQSMIFPSEEVDRRVNNDIERLMRQAAEMSKATRSVLVAIESAREAVRTQVNALNGSSEQAADRLASLGQTLEYRMRDAASMGQALEEAVQSIETRAEKGHDAWQNLVANINTNTTEAEEKINAGRERLESTVNRVQQTTQKLAEKIDSSTSSSEMTIARLANMLQERLDSIGSLHEETEKALQKATDEMAVQRRDLRLDAEAIEEKTYGLSDALQKGVQKLYDYSDDALDKSKLIETRLQGQSTSLETVLNQAVDHAAHIEDRTKQAVEKLENVAQNTLGGLHDVTDKAVDKLQNVTQKTMDTFQTVTDQAIEKLESSTGNTLNSLQSVTRDAVDQLSDTTNQTMQGIQSSTRYALGSLQSVTREAVEQLNDTTHQTTQSIQNSTRDAVSTLTSATQSTLGNLKVVTDESVAKFQEVSGNTVNKVTETTEKAVSTLQDLTDRTVAESQKIENVLQGAIVRLEDCAMVAVQQAQDSLANSSNRLVTDIDEVSTRAKTIANDMLGEINSKVVDTTSAFVYIQKQIQSLATLFDQRKLHLDEAGAGARLTAETLQKTLQNALDKVHDTTLALQSGIAAIHKSVQEPILLVENTAQNAYQKAEDIGRLLENKAGNLTAITVTLGDHMNAMEVQFQDKGQNVALLAGKVAGHLESVTQSLTSQNTVLQDNIGKSTDSLDELVRTQERITKGLLAMQEQVGNARTQSTETTDEIQKRVDLLQQLQRSLANDSKDAQAQIDRASDRLISISTGTVDKIKQTLEDMTLLEADYHRLSDTGIEDIRRLETNYRGTLNHIGTDADYLMTKMSGIHDGLHEVMREAKHAVDQHLHSIQDTAGQIKEVSANVIGEASTIQTETARVQELGNASQNVLDQLLDVSRSMDERMAESHNHVSVQIGSLRGLMNDMREQSMQTVDHLIRQEENLEKNIQQQAERISETGQRFLDQGDAIQKHMLQTAQTADQYTVRIQEHAGTLRQEAEQFEHVFGGTIGKLLEQGQQVDVSATRLIEKINQANMDLMQQGKTLQNSGDDILSRIQSVSSDMGTRALALEQAAQLAQKQAEALRAQESKLQRDAFFNSTKFVVESLHSLALDFTRLLEGELPEKTWRSYQKGDTGSFTRRLLSARDEETRDKIKNKFKDDVEFRTYVTRYLRQFEEIYDHAVQNDHADLLSTIFMTSDVGKLYVFMCNVLDRESRSLQKQAA